MDTTLIVATGHGIFTYQRHEQEWRALARGLDGHHVTSAIAREGVILAGTTTGVFRSDDAGETWQAASDGLTTRHVRWMAFHPERSDNEFVGTEPAAIFVSHNGALSWRECPEVAQLRDEHSWMLRIRRKLAVCAALPFMAHAPTRPSKSAARCARTMAAKPGGSQKAATATLTSKGRPNP